MAHHELGGGRCSLCLRLAGKSQKPIINGPEPAASPRQAADLVAVRILATGCFGSRAKAG